MTVGHPLYVFSSSSTSTHTLHLSTCWVVSVNSTISLALAQNHRSHRLCRHCQHIHQCRHLQHNQYPKLNKNLKEGNNVINVFLLDEDGGDLDQAIGAFFTGPLSTPVEWHNWIKHSTLVPAEEHWSRLFSSWKAMKANLSSQDPRPTHTVFPSRYLG